MKDQTIITALKIANVLEDQTIVPVQTEVDDGVRIVILQRGWVFVGRFSQSGARCKLTNASCVRVWGTQHGLGEIAENGPTAKTVLDKTPDVEFHELTVVAIIQCKAEKWSKYV